MAVTNFVPDLWSARLLVTLRKNTVAAALCNRDYEGEIRQRGDSVKITGLVRPTIGTYTSHTDIVIEDIDDTTRSLVIDQSKYFGFELDDVERAQSVNGGSVLAQALDDASYSLRDVADTFLFTTIGAGVLAGNQIAESSVTSANAYDKLVDMAVKLDESNVPTEGRWAVITPAFHGLLLKDPRFIGSGDAQGAETRANGRVGEAAGLTIFKSNNLQAGPGAGAGKLLLAGSNSATTFAEQIVSVEATRLEKRFADAVKGLHVYGAKVIRPEALVSADVIVA
ncbi:P22 phage major capsid protein family protein [Rhodococcus triatomae]|nr:hypothetical protein G419_25292 [Rhodococcus triatomae BKS 15-14]